MRIVHEDKDFYAVYDAPIEVRAYLKRTVPVLYRRFESEPSPRWLVHSKYLVTINEIVEYEAAIKTDPHTTLFLTKDAPGFMIDAAWKALALHHHPDRGGSEADFKRVKEAYEELNERNNDGGSP